MSSTKANRRCRPHRSRLLDEPLNVGVTDVPLRKGAGVLLLGRYLGRYLLPSLDSWRTARSSSTRLGSAFETPAAAGLEQAQRRAIL